MFMLIPKKGKGKMLGFIFYKNYKKKKKYKEEVIKLVSSLIININEIEDSYYKELNILDLAFSRKYNIYEGALLEAYISANSLLIANLDKNMLRSNINNFLLNLSFLQEDWYKNNKIKTTFFDDTEDIFNTLTIKPKNLYFYIFDAPDIKDVNIKRRFEDERFSIDFYDNVLSIKEALLKENTRKYIYVVHIKAKNSSSKNSCFITLEKSLKESYLMTCYANNYIVNLGYKKEYLEEDTFIMVAINYYKNKFAKGFQRG